MDDEHHDVDFDNFHHLEGSHHDLSQNFGKEEKIRLFERSGERPDLEGGEVTASHESQLSLGKTIFIVLRSITALVIFGFLLLVIINRYIIMPEQDSSRTEGSVVVNFRRPESEYILDPFWDFDASPTIREYSFTLTNIFENPDGVYRPLVTVNQQFPGPLIQCNEGDVLKIMVDNRSVKATALHFHGIYQNDTNFMDGTSGVTQCPIAPGRKFEYVFNVTDQSGTFYYHGHQGVQASDGFFGPLIIHPRKEKQQQSVIYASDRVIMLQDHYHDASDALLFKSMRPGFEGTPTPDGALINGRNTRDCSKLDPRNCDNTTASHAMFELKRNEGHRLRFINVGALAYFHVSIDEHDLAIVEADGTDLIPVSRSRLMIAPAQRYSAIIHARQTNESSFWLRAKMMTHCWGDNPADATAEASEVKAIVRYIPMADSEVHAANVLTQELVSMADNNNLIQNCLDMGNLTPEIKIPAPAIATYSYYLESNIAIGDWRLERGYLNTSSFRPNVSSPTLHRVLKSLEAHETSFMHDGVNNAFFNQDKELVIQHRKTEVVDIIIHNSDEQSHPMHLHGHKFWVLGSGHTRFPGYAALGLQPFGKGTLPGKEHVLDDLIRRDVATLRDFGWLAIRVVLDNPGVWAFHCHMAWHSEKGLGMLFVSRLDDMRGWKIPEDNKALCDASVEELEKGMPPKDSLWEGDLTTDAGED